MKKLIVLFVLLFTTLVSFNTKGQTPPDDFFVGKWDVILIGLPDGDQPLVFHIERKDGKLIGKVFDPKKDKEGSEFTKVEEAKKSITVYFTAAGTNVYVLLEKKDDNNLIGSLLDIFDVTAVRKK